MRTRSRLSLSLLALAIAGLSCSQPAAAPVAASGAPAPALADPGAAPPVVDPTPQPAGDPGPKLQTAGSLQYLEIVLGGAQPDEPLPMIVAIHGLGDAPENFAHLFDTFTEKARLVLPRGVDPSEGGGWSWFPLRARDADVDGLSRGIASSADAIAEAIAELKSQRPTRGAPIVTGFSQGGMLAFAVAARHPEVVGAALPIGGWLPPPLVPQSLREGVKYPPIHAFHGTEDVAVKYAPTVASVQALTALGVPAELHTYEGVGHVITPEIHRDVTDAIVDAVRSAR
jgi:phospholipase/carboxylesterase